MIAQAGSAGTGGALLMNRVGRVLRDMAAERALSDQEIRQHALDCAWLMERAYDRFQQTEDPADRKEAMEWQARQKAALASMSPEWKAAREAQIAADIADSFGAERT